MWWPPPNPARSRSRTEASSWLFKGASQSWWEGSLSYSLLPPDHRHHGFLWPVPHQAEEAGDGDTGVYPSGPQLPGSHPWERPWDSGAVLRWLCGLQVRVLELEKTLEAERVRLGELRKQHYVLAGVMGTPGEEEPSRPSPAPRSGATKKPPLAQKPSIAPRPDNQVPGIDAGLGRRACQGCSGGPHSNCTLSPSSLTPTARQKGWCLPSPPCELLGP